MNYTLNKVSFLIPVLFILFLLCVPQKILYALDWKSLHEQADTSNPVSAKACLKEKGDSPENLYVLALTYLNEHKDKEADELFRQLAGRDSRASEYAWGSAEVLRRNHESEKSKEILIRLIKEFPAFAPAYVSLSYIKYREMDFNQTARLASQVISLGIQNVDLSNLVRAYLLVGGAKGMIANYGGPLSKVINGTAVLPNLKKAEKLQPNNAGVLFGVGSFYFLAPPFVGGDLARAIGYLEKAIKADPLFADAYVRLGQAYSVKGDDKKYREYTHKALEIDPKNELALDAQSKKCKFMCRGLENR